MTPLPTQVLFKPFLDNEISENGLFIPETARGFSDRGIIIKCGKGTAKKPMTLKEGMIAHRVHKWGERYEENDEVYFLMDAAAIIAIE